MSISSLETEGKPVPALIPAKTDLPWIPLVFFGALLILLYLPVLSPVVSQWGWDENMGYAYFVPPVAAYIFWLDREKILAAPVKPYWPALSLLVVGFCLMLVGFLGALSILCRVAFIVTMIGMIWTIAGTAVLRASLFPVLLLLFMFPVPLYLYQRLTLPLQSLAASLAAGALDLIGIPVLQVGNTLNLPDKQLEVVEACSGIRSLLSLTFLAVAYGRLCETRLWIRLALLVSTVPIAIVCNASRITLTGILTQYKPEIAEGAYHEFQGWVIFMFELVVLLSFHRVLTRFGRKANA